MKIKSTIKEVTKKLQTGKTPPSKEKKYFNGDINWFTPGDLNTKLLKKSKRTITQLAYDNGKAISYPKNTVLLSCIGDIGKIGITTNDNSSSNQQITGLIPDQSKITSEYLYYWCLEHKKLLESKATSVTVPMLNNKRLEKIVIYYEQDIDTQIRISNLLSQVESLIAKREESIKLLDELLKSTFLDMFGDPVLNPKGWKKDILLNLTTKIGSGSTPKGGKEVYLDKGYYFIRSQNVRMNKLIYETMYCIDETIHNKMKNTWVKNGDVLLNITGASIGRVAYFEGKDNSANVNQHVSILRPKSDEINYIYLSYCMSQENFQKQIMKKNVGGTRESFNFSQIKNFKVPKPAKPLQDKFATIVKQVEQTKQQHQKSLQELKKLFGSLSQRAFRGELDLSKMKIKASSEDAWTKKALAKQDAYDKAIEERVYESGMSHVGTTTFKTIPVKNIETYVINLLKDDNFDIDEMEDYFGIDFSYDDFKNKFYKLLDEKKVIQEFDTQQKKMKFKIKS